MEAEIKLTTKAFSGKPSKPQVTLANFLAGNISSLPVITAAAAPPGPNAFDWHWRALIEALPVIDWESIIGGNKLDWVRRQ